MPYLDRLPAFKNSIGYNFSTKMWIGLSILLLLTLSPDVPAEEDPSKDPWLTDFNKAKTIADSMGWAFEHRPVGYGDLETRLVELMRDGVN